MTRNYKNVRTAAAVLGESQLKFRLGLARQRTQLHPLDSMNFIMMDLERPDGCRRFADFCTGDLTGRCRRPGHDEMTATPQRHPITEEMRTCRTTSQPTTRTRKKETKETP